jgi:asparagine synthase (glutamine-hydrolysing)
MCGIAGILSFDAQPPRVQELAAMAQALRHRGPDGTGFYRDNHAGLAHTRLSVIDLEGGAQPMRNEDGSVWSAVNGEIFNYRALRAQLEQCGHRFRTASDCETVVHAYEEYGLKFLDHLNGQFAIALWDRRQRRLLLARDRTGIRPLFHATANGRVLFASEVKALFTDPKLPRSLDRRALAQTLTYWSALAPRSTFTGVSAVPPGHCLVIEGRDQRLLRYCDWDFPEEATRDTRSAEDCAAELRELLTDAVRLQLQADLPVGAYLSGGLDSSLVAALAARIDTSPLRTFALAFDDAEFDESAFQQDMARHLGTQHTTLRCANAQIGAAFRRALWHVEAPLVRTAAVPLMLLSERVRAEGFKVVLTGEGADEVFAGYDLFREAKVRRFWAREPASRLRPLALARLYPWLRQSPVAAQAFSQQFFGEGMAHAAEPYFAHLPRWTAMRRIGRFFSRDMHEALAGWDPLREFTGWLQRPLGRWAPLARDQYVEAHTLLSGHLLSSQGDRVAMANAVEGRHPFLDHRVIEFANRLPPHYKLRGLTEKYVLRKAAQGLLPETIRRRTKQPYRAPEYSSFMHGAVADEVQELLGAKRLREAGYFDPLAVGKLLDKCRSGRAIGFGDNTAFVAILSTMMLDDLFVRGVDRPAQRAAAEIPVPA